MKRLAVLLVALAATLALTAQPAEAAVRRGLVVAVGDSITAGYGGQADQSWPAQYDRATWRLVVNAGVSGACLTQCGNGIPHVLATVGRSFALRPARVVLMVGINDLNAGVHPAHIIAGYKTVRAEGRRRGIRVILATIPPTNPVCGCHVNVNRDRHTVNRWILAQRDVVRLGPVLSDRFGNLRADLSDDGIHPNVAGAAVIARTVRLHR